MNYDRIYQELMAAARHRGTDKSKLHSYYELHHIVPKCLGGSEDEANLVLLTAREHFIAHRLLAKEHPNNCKLLFAVAAFRMDSGERLLTSRQIAVAREANSVAISQLVAEGKHNWQAAEFRWALSQRRAQLVAEGKHNFQAASFRKATSLRHAQLAAEGKHHWQTAEFREAQSQRITQRNAEKATCPYCSKIGGATIMRRWHFDNCRHRQASLGC